MGSTIYSLKLSSSFLLLSNSTALASSFARLRLARSVTKVTISVPPKIASTAKWIIC